MDKSGDLFTPEGAKEMKTAPEKTNKAHKKKTKNKNSITKQTKTQKSENTKVFSDFCGRSGGT